jgi:ribosomal protein S18 acetylase RimI-like enzyme
MTPEPPPRTIYVDALAVDAGSRRQGIATALLDDAADQARRAGAEGVALDTGVENDGAQAFYERAGFERRGERRAPDERTARAVGGAGFISYFRAA